MAKVCVIGSLNIDLTVNIPRFHEPGETIFSTAFNTYLGGKGGNQAVCAAKLGNEVMMVAKLGDDQYAQLYRNIFKELKIDDSTVLTAKGESTGIAIIEVDNNGENRIVAVNGANACVDINQVESLMPKIMEYDVFLLQLEIPIPTMAYLLKKLHKANKTIILDPAPAVTMPNDFLEYITIVTPNETELAIHASMPTKTDEQVVMAARHLIKKGAKKVVAKLGSRGAMLITSNDFVIVKAFKVNAVDTTAAGDSFNAGLATAIANGKSDLGAVLFANATAAISTTDKGAQAAMPSYNQVVALIKEQS